MGKYVDPYQHKNTFINALHGHLKVCWTETRCDSLNNVTCVTIDLSYGMSTDCGTINALELLTEEIS